MRAVFGYYIQKQRVKKCQSAEIELHGRKALEK